MLSRLLRTARSVTRVSAHSAAARASAKLPSAAAHARQSVGVRGVATAPTDDSRYVANPFATMKFDHSQWLTPTHPPSATAAAKAAATFKATVDGSVHQPQTEFAPFTVDKITPTVVASLLHNTLPPSPATITPSVCRPLSPMTAFTAEFCKTLVRYGEATLKGYSDPGQPRVEQRWYESKASTTPLGDALRQLYGAIAQSANPQAAATDAGVRNHLTGVNTVIQKRHEQLQLYGAMGAEGAAVCLPDLQPYHAATIKSLMVKDPPKAEQNSFWGSARQLLYGQVVSQIAASRGAFVHPLAAVVMNPTGGIVGPGTDNIEEQVLITGYPLEVFAGITYTIKLGEAFRPALAYHSVAHDAAGFCFNSTLRCGPGYMYRSGADDENDPKFAADWKSTLNQFFFPDTAHSYSFQAGGVAFWKTLLDHNPDLLE